MKAVELMYIWTVYLLKCSDGSYYCGITLDLKRRVKEHNAGKGSKYTRGRVPVKVVTQSGFYTHGDALRLEKKVKGLRRDRKISYLNERSGGRHNSLYQDVLITSVQ